MGPLGGGGGGIGALPVRPFTPEPPISSSNRVGYYANRTTVAEERLRRRRLEGKEVQEAGAAVLMGVGSSSAASSVAGGGVRRGREPGSRGSLGSPLGNTGKGGGGAAGLGQGSPTSSPSCSPTRQATRRNRGTVRGPGHPPRLLAASQSPLRNSPQDWGGLGMSVGPGGGGWRPRSGGQYPTFASAGLRQKGGIRNRGKATSWAEPRESSWGQDLLGR
ncbi:unnamed protein product, partial [Discosporangium mesarthrocarpum]